MRNTLSRRLGVITLSICLATSAVPTKAATDPQLSKLSTKVRVSKDFTFMADLLKTFFSDGLSCKNYKKNDGTTGVREEGTCTFHGQTLTLDLFADGKTAKTMAGIFKGMAGGYILGSNNWTILVNDAATARLITQGFKIKIY